MIGGVRSRCGPGRISRSTGVQDLHGQLRRLSFTKKDMGPDSLNLAKNMERYNTPTRLGSRTDDQWPADLVATL